MMNSTFLTLGESDQKRRLALLRVSGKGPDVVWLGGLRSDMRATKAKFLAHWARQAGRAMTRFDYSGHGESEGRFEDGTIGRWLEDAFAVIDTKVEGQPILVGSSMGGWIALLVARQLVSLGRPPVGLVLIAPAVDFTERLLWANLSDAAKKNIMDQGCWMQTSAYASDPYPITKHLIIDGRRHLILEKNLSFDCPIHILQGMADLEVPWQHAIMLAEHLASHDVTVTLIKDGDHRLSRRQDLEKLVEAVEGITGNATPIL